MLLVPTRCGSESPHPSRCELATLTTGATVSTSHRKAHTTRSRRLRTDVTYAATLAGYVSPDLSSSSEVAAVLPHVQDGCGHRCRQNPSWANLVRTQGAGLSRCCRRNPPMGQ
jgi:hypothetical protein